MKVRAKAVSGQKYSGYYDHKRRVAGEVFVLIPITKIAKDGRKIIITPENQFSERWMEKVEKDVPAVSKTNDQPVMDAPLTDDVI